MSRRWCRELHDRGIAAVIAAVGGVDWVDPDRPNKGVTPCPICHQPTRHRRSRDKRGAVSITPDGCGWWCVQCGAKGDTVTLACLLITGRTEITPDIRDECVKRGLIGYRPLQLPERNRVAEPGTDWQMRHAHRWWQAAIRSNRGGTYADMYLSNRGLPDDSRRMIKSGYISVGKQDEVLGWPEAARKQVEWMLRRNRLLVLPLRDAYHGHVRGLAVKGFARQPKAGVLAGQSLSYRSCPYGYGDAGGSLRSDVLILCEGAIDTLAAECMFHGVGSVSVAGAISAGCMGTTWAEWLKRRRHGHVMVVHHLDDAGGQAGEAVVDSIRSEGGSARMIDWDALIQAMGVGATAATITDLTDMVRAVGYDSFGRLAQTVRREAARL